MEKRKVVIISNDALVKEDAEYLLTKPAFRNIVKEGSWVKTCKTVYPSVTYCCHSSMITGCYPAKTGVHNNEYDEFGNTDWMFERKYIKTKTLIDAFKEKGYTVANVFWPVLGNDKNIDYNIDEYWSQTPDDKLEDALKRMGASDKVVEEIIRPNLYYIEGHQRKHPYADEFVFACARDLIQKYSPDLLVVHPAGIDGMRHAYGNFDDHVTEQLDYTYYWVEKIVRALKETGVYDNTDIILTADHGQFNSLRGANPNVILRERGYIEKGKDGKYVATKAYIKGIGGCAQVFVTDKSEKTKKEVYDLFCELRDLGTYGIEIVYSKEECKKMGLDGNFEFAIESDGYTSICDDVEGPYFTKFNIPSDSNYRGDHGGLPDRGTQPSTFFVGPDFKKGVIVERRDIVDIAATLKKIFNLDMPDVDGKPIEEIIK